MLKGVGWMVDEEVVVEQMDMLTEAGSLWLALFWLVLRFWFEMDGMRGIGVWLRSWSIGILEGC